MRPIEFAHPHDRRHFEFFRGMNHPHWNLTVEVRIDPWIEMARSRGLKVTPAIVHLLARAANDVPQLRRRIRDQGAVEHDVVHPTFSVATDVAESFSFCHVPYGEDLGDFVGRATSRMAEVSADPVFEDEEGRDDFLYMSALPWVAFTSIQHAMSYHPHDSVPRISWGRFVERGGETRMALSLQAHHALVDGAHAARFYQRIEALVSEQASAAA